MQVDDVGVGDWSRGMRLGSFMWGYECARHEGRGFRVMNQIDDGPPMMGVRERRQHDMCATVGLG